MRKREEVRKIKEELPTGPPIFLLFSFLLVLLFLFLFCFCFCFVFVFFLFEFPSDFGANGNSGQIYQNHTKNTHLNHFSLP